MLTRWLNNCIRFCQVNIFLPYSAVSARNNIISAAHSWAWPNVNRYLCFKIHRHECRKPREATSVQQTEVPPNLHASSPRCQQLHGMCHPVRAMAATRQNTGQGIIRRDATELNAFCVEHDEQSSPSCMQTFMTQNMKKDGKPINRTEIPGRDENQRAFRASLRLQTTAGRFRYTRATCSTELAHQRADQRLLLVKY